MKRVLSLALLLAMSLAGGATAAPLSAVEAPAFSALVFSKTGGFRHASIPNGIAAIRDLGANHSFSVTATEDAGAFTDAGLAAYDVVIFLSTTGDVLNGEQQAAFERFIGAGGGYVGIHSAADTEYDWPWYGDLLGAYFRNHPSVQAATVVRADRLHPSTRPLPARWRRTDEWYNFRTNPRSGAHVLATVDESSYSPGPGGMGRDHPIAWCHEFRGGRAWYTALGHTSGSYGEALFRRHLLGGIRFAAGTPRRARIRGTTGPDVIDCVPGNDLVLALAGNDRIRTGAGNDTVYAGLGNDFVRGDRGRDRLDGGGRHDRLLGGLGADTLVGGRGRDRLFARDGFRDLLVCGTGFDVVVSDRLDRVGASCEVVRRG
jgi:type 1 glutamine amidotransferase